MKLTLVLELPEEHLQALLERAESRYLGRFPPKERQRMFTKDLEETLSKIFNPNETNPG